MWLLPDELSTLTTLTVLRLHLPDTFDSFDGIWPIPLAAPALEFLSLYSTPFGAVADGSYPVHPLGQLTGALIAALLCFSTPMTKPRKVVLLLLVCT